MVNVELPASESMFFETTLQDVSMQLRQQTQKEVLSYKIYHNVKLEKMLSARFVPISIKHMAMRYGFKHAGEDVKTMTLTNMGRIQLPSSMSKYVQRMEVVMYPTEKSPINCGICSVNNQLTITFSRSIVEIDIIRNFFLYLSQTVGLKVKVYSNDWGIE